DRGVRPRTGADPAQPGAVADRPGQGAAAARVRPPSRAAAGRARPLLLRRGDLRPSSWDDRAVDVGALPAARPRTQTRNPMTSLPPQPLSPLDGRNRPAV